MTGFLVVSHIPPVAHIHHDGGVAMLVLKVAKSCGLERFPLICITSGEMQN